MNSGRDRCNHDVIITNYLNSTLLRAPGNLLLCLCTPGNPPHQWCLSLIHTPVSPPLAQARCLASTLSGAVRVIVLPQSLPLGAMASLAAPHRAAGRRPLGRRERRDAMDPTGGSGAGGPLQHGPGQLPNRPRRRTAPRGIWEAPAPSRASSITAVVQRHHLRIPRRMRPAPPRARSPSSLTARKFVPQIATLRQL